MVDDDEDFRDALATRLANDAAHCLALSGSWLIFTCMGQQFLGPGGEFLLVAGRIG
jgi:hypothetical protein